MEVPDREESLWPLQRTHAELAPIKSIFEE
jgi:hypothetical protein